MKPLVVTMGDPAGIGLEITCAAWAKREECALPPFALIADPETVAERTKSAGLHAPLRTINRLEDAPAAFRDGLPVLVPAQPLRAPVRPGRPDPANASAVIAAIDMAVDAVAEGQAAAVVTNPIAKSVLSQAGFAYPGHTEYLAALAARRWAESPRRPVMMLASADLRVVPLTVHVPLASVSRQIDAHTIEETLRIMVSALIADFGVRAPRIAVAGLNPHAGESGTLGTEERDVIAPAVEALRAQGFAVRGPLSADTLFHAAARTTYDAVLAMYHDQALIPIKTLAFDAAVNVTLGLPFVRTSPDHGTAFDIAGSGRGSALSLIEAMRLADQMARRRSRQGP